MKNKKNKKKQIPSSVGVIIFSLLLAYLPIPGAKKTVVVVSGSELAEPLQEIAKTYQAKNPDIELILKVQGSQDIVNNYIDQKNDFKPTVIIPASGEFLNELQQRWTAENKSDAFYGTPTPIAKTLLVAIAWPERAQVLFPNGNFSWQKIEQAMLAKNWEKIGGQKTWGSFDFLTTDPTRSNSGQVTLNLWTQSKGKNLNDEAIASLFETIKSSVYQPPRSTDILLQEFITKGPNDADVATVYENVALARWQESSVNQKPYQIYYPNPTVETTATAAIVTRDVTDAQIQASQDFVKFLQETEQQKTLAKYGFRPISNNIDLKSLPDSPWAKNIPGEQLTPQVKIEEAPKKEELGEILRVWQRTR